VYGYSINEQHHSGNEASKRENLRETAIRESDDIEEEAAAMLVY